MPISDLTTEFSSSINIVMNKITGTDSIYDKTLIKLSGLYTSLGMSAEARDKAIMEVSAQLAVSSTNAAISAAVEMAKSARIIDAQVLTEGSKKLLIDNQAATEIENALGVVSQTAVKDAQKLLIDNQAATEIENALGVVAQTAVKDAQKLLIDNQAATEIKNALGVVAQTAVKDAQKALIDKQVLTEVKKALLVVRQTTGFSDKLKVEVMKAMGGVASMEATDSSGTITTLADLKVKINNVESSAI